MRSETRRKRGGIVFAAILVVGALGAAAVPVYDRITGAPTSFDRIDEARRENRPLFESLGLPPGAKPYNPVEENVYRRRSQLTVTLDREFSAPGSFESVVRWYEAHLAAMGWKPFDRSNWRDFQVDFCRAPWLLVIARLADYPTDRPPHHRFNLRLEWRKGFEAERCPLP